MVLIKTRSLSLAKSRPTVFDRKRIST